MAPGWRALLLTVREKLLESKLCFCGRAANVTAIRGQQLEILKVDFNTLEMVTDKSKMEEITNQVSRVSKSHVSRSCDRATIF